LAHDPGMGTRKDPQGLTHRNTSLRMSSKAPTTLIPESTEHEELTVVAQSRPDFALTVLAKAVEGTEGLEGERGEASEMAWALLDALRPPST